MKFVLLLRSQKSCNIKKYAGTLQAPRKESRQFIQNKLTFIKNHPLKFQNFWQQQRKYYSSFFSINTLSSKIKNFPSYKLGNFIDDKGNAVLLKTDRFSVIIPRDKQTVLGVLRIEPIDSRLNAWDEWKDEDWRQLIQIQRLNEFALISVFDKRDPKLKPTQDNKLVNFFGKQRSAKKKTEIYFEIAPRYGKKDSKPIAMVVSNDTFTDELYGKPFDFSNKKTISEEAYTEIATSLRTALQTTDFSQFVLDDDFSKKWDNCYSCKHPKLHPEGVGLMQIGKQGTGAEFFLSLDSRSQEEKGRTFCESDLHIPALRYWEDERMVMLGEIFKYWRCTVNNVYPFSIGQREFDLAILMNLARPPDGTHTHGHFIPRTSGSIDYGMDFQMDPKKYIPLVKGNEREKIVSNFTTEFVNQLSTSSKLQIHWAHLSKTSLENNTNNMSTFKF